MQAFQPKPINLPGASPTMFNNDNFGRDNSFSKKNILVIALISLLLLAVIIMVVGRKYNNRVRQVVENQNVRPLGLVHTGVLQVSTPAAGELIRFPLFIQGTAKLEWFSDGVFPVEVRDGKNNILESTYAIADIIDPKAQTANFRAVIEGFDQKPETRIGRIILYRQNIKKNLSEGNMASIGVDFGILDGAKWMGYKTIAKDKKEVSEEEKIKKANDMYNVLVKRPFDSGARENNSTTTTSITEKEKTGYQPVIGGPYTCANGIDDDKDGLIDSEDPSCHTDGYPSNDRTYSGDLDEAKRAFTELD